MALLMINDQKVRGGGDGLLRRDNKDSRPTQMEVGDRLSYWNYGEDYRLSCRPLGPVENAGCHCHTTTTFRVLWVMVYGFGADVSHLRFSIPCSRIVRDIRHSRSHMRHPGDESSTF